MRLIITAMILAVALAGCTPVERSAYNTAVGAKAFLDKERSVHPECATGATTTVCGVIKKAVSAKDELINAIEIYCGGPDFNVAGGTGACNAPAKGTPAATQATAKLQNAIQLYKQIAADLKGLK